MTVEEQKLRHKNDFKGCNKVEKGKPPKKDWELEMIFLSHTSI